MPTPAAPFDPLGPRLLTAAWLMGFALATRWAVLGDLAYFNDEYFYWAAALRLHDGLVPYVDVWDRKGPGLFLTYWLITGVYRGVLGFQVAALLSAGATAFTLARIARRFTGPAGALGAGTLYLAMLPMYGGAGGQSPVFYNLWMALAALLLLRARAALEAGRLSVGALGAMALAGFALTFKQSAAPEAALFGLTALWWLRRALPLGAVLLRASALMAAGLAPFALFGAIYAGIGHFGAFWQAMVTANLAKGYDPAGDHWLRIRAMAISASPTLVLALAGLALPGPALHAKARGWLALWLLAALAGLASVPNFYHHYMLPVLLPLALAAGLAINPRPWGWLGGVVAVAIFLTAGGTFDIARRAEGRTAIAQLAATIRARDPAPRLLVYEGPMALYGLVGSYPPSPLLDNFHLYFPPENNTSQYDTRAEMARDLAWRPSVVITYHAWPAAEENQRTAPLVHAYTRRCRLWQTLTYPESVLDVTVDVWGDCR